MQPSGKPHQAVPYGKRKFVIEVTCLDKLLGVIRMGCGEVGGVGVIFSHSDAVGNFLTCL